MRTHFLSACENLQNYLMNAIVQPIQIPINHTQTTLTTRTTFRIPSHVDIKGNKEEDEAARSATSIT